MPGPHTAPQTVNNWFSMQEVALGLGVYGPGPNPQFRDALDAARLNWRQTPEGSYPDGYLGTVGGRRGDKLRNAVWRNQRPYDRGVHKDTRLDMSDYLWPEEFNLMSGVVNELTGLRYVSPAIAIGPLQLTNRGKPNTRDYNNMTGRPDTGTPIQVDPGQQAAKRRMLPRWS
jgi:hypothetical protein